METKEVTKMDNLIKLEMAEMKKDLHEMKGQMKEVYQALVGNDLSGEGGFKGRQLEHEQRIKALEKFRDEYELRSSKIEFYQKIIWALCGGGAVTLIGYLLQLLVHK